MGTIAWLSIVLGVPKILVSAGVVGIACAIALPMSKKSETGNNISGTNNREITVKVEMSPFERSKLNG